MGFAVVRVFSGDRPCPGCGVVLFHRTFANSPARATVANNSRSAAAGARIEVRIRHAQGELPKFDFGERALPLVVAATRVFHFDAERRITLDQIALRSNAEHMR